MEQPLPRLVFSACLGFDHCRYNGGIIQDEFCELLKGFVEPIPVCPEKEIGLGVPRDPIRIVYKNNDPQLIQPATNRNLTITMRSFASEFLKNLPPVDGFLLKSRSPSCGIRDVLSTDEKNNTRPAAIRTGLFGKMVLTHFPNTPVTDEGRLKNFLIRENFLTRVFALTRFRMVRASPTMANLIEFHTTHKLLLMAYNQQGLHYLGKIVANHEHHPLPILINHYETVLSRTLARPPKYNNAINVLFHALGYFSRRLTSKEKSFFLDTIEKYRRGKLPLSVPVNLLRSWVVRFDEPYLCRQWFFNPYPEQLQNISDSGKGRNR